MCGLCNAGIKAQVDTATYHRLSDVEVVGKVRPSVTREATPLQVMDRAGIERIGAQDLSEVVKRFSGVTVQDYGGIGGLKTVSVRSLGAKHTAVSYDGVTVTDAQNGQIDISRFSLDNVEMLSLAIGQADDIFQTARMYASAGALNIQTRKPDFSFQPVHLKAQLKGGSFGLINPYVRYEQKIGNKWYTTVHADYLRGDGDYPFTLVNGQLVEEKKRQNSDIESWRAELNLHGDFGKGGELSVKGYYFDSERGLPGSVILYNDYSGERLWDKNAFMQAFYENKWNEKMALKVQLKYNYSWTKYVDVNNKYETGRQEDRYRQHEYYGSVVGRYTPIDHIAIVVAEDFFVNSLHNTLPECPFPERYTSLSAVAAQYKNHRLTTTASLLATYITEKVESGSSPDDRKRLSPAISASWRILPNENLRLRFSYKDIFRIPTFNDLYYLRIGNTNLKPEKATQFNLGLTWGGELALIRYLSFSVDGYYNKVKDKIVAMPTMFVWKMINMGEVSIGGVDVNLSADVPLYKRWNLLLQTAYTYQKAVDITDKSAKNYRNQIPYTPEHTGNVSVSLMNPWLNVSYNITCVGNRYALPQNITDNMIRKYAEQSLAVNREFKIKHCMLRLQGELLNLSDKTYDVIQFYPMPGRSWRLGVSVSY